jgi:hypothetical protein
MKTAGIFQAQTVRHLGCSPSFNGFRNTRAKQVRDQRKYPHDQET